MSINNWPEDSSLKRKYFANYVLMTIYVFCLIGKITLSYCITQRGGSYPNYV